MTAVVEICRRLDGIALAIELAAARCRQLAPERIAHDLGQRFRLLTGGSRTSLPRQQTLLASVAWSHDLLDDDERRVLRRLAVCAGVFRLRLAEALGSAFGDLDAWAVLDVLGRLVDKSLVQVDDHVDRHGHTDTQYRLLETIRQYALDRSGDAGELTALRDAHADWWIAELERIDARQPTWEVLDLTGRHLLDLRAALDWLEPDRSAVPAALARHPGVDVGRPHRRRAGLRRSLAAPWPARRRRNGAGLGPGDVASASALFWALRIDHDLAVRAFDRQCKPKTAAPPSPAVGTAGDQADRPLASWWRCSWASTTTATC